LGNGAAAVSTDAAGRERGRGRLEVASMETSSRNMYNFTNKGARWSEIRRLALQIKFGEKQTKTEVKLVWVALCPVEIQTVDDRSRLSTSTDKWGLQRSQLAQLYLRFQLQPTVDALASSSNA
jgi:hypothetical protein